ncbi:MAG: tetratricopeptide repeat protein [Proteobacteria bacterium]|nr:tetratricopeptide repeat protein [Pseudomonadota bacterium]
MRRSPLPLQIFTAMLVAVGIMITVMSATQGLAAGIYTQLVLPFTTEREVTQRYDKSAHALVLTFHKTAPNELPALDQYDERLIKRTIIKELGPYGTEVKFILRDRDVRALVSTFKEPFRVAVDIYDADFTEERDPSTGMPVASESAGNASPESTTSNRSESNVVSSEHPEASKFKLVAPGSTDPSMLTTAANPNASGPGRKLLVAPPSQLFATPEQLSAGMRQAQDGTGKAWRDFPPYIYALKTAAYEEGLSRRPKLPTAQPQVLSSAEAMADYAGKLFNMGHEAKALVAYEQVLRRDHSVFDRDALHLWRFAEAQLGQGNLTLADGYFAALVQKHPESPLADFAKLRKLDIAAIRYHEAENVGALKKLLVPLATIKPHQNGELAAQIALRLAWWSAASATAKSPDAKALPALTGPVHAALVASYPVVESSRTAFLTASLLLSDMLNPNTAWQRSTGQFAEGYFKRFTGSGAEPYKSELEQRFDAKLNANLQSKIESGKLVEAIDDFESLPKSRQKVKQSTKIAWYLAEAYRKLGQSSKAIDLYAAAAKSSTEGPDRFKSSFWLAVTAGEGAEEAKQNGADPSRISSLAALSRNADKSAEQAWDRLSAEEKAKLTVAYKEPFEQTIKSPAKIRIGPKIVLNNWTDALTTKKSTQNGGENTDWTRNFSPSGSAVLMLADLGKRFGQLGMANERKQAISLLKYMTPKEFADDAAAKKVWASELTSLAEDYRKANQYLDAGRLLAQVGADAENIEGRAEALYKGGLLLYRAGRRAEAIESFKKASEDGNNLFYSNLAKERLSQLQ